MSTNKHGTVFDSFMTRLLPANIMNIADKHLHSNIARKRSIEAKDGYRFGLIENNSRTNPKSYRERQ